MKRSSWFFTLIFVCAVVVSSVIMACGSDEPTKRQESSSSERATSTSPSGTGRADAEDRDSSQVSGAFSDVLALIPADAEEVALLDVQTIRKNPNRFPGNFRVFEEELVEKIENELDTEEIGFDQVGYFVRFRGVEWGQETLVTGDLAFNEIRDDWEEQGKEKESYGNYEIWGSDIVVFEDEGAILTAGQREQLDRLAGAPGPLADADDENLKMILDRLGNSPATFADVDTDYGCDLDGCLGFGAAFTRFDTDRQWIHVDLVMLFSDKKMTEQAVDEYDALVEEMDDNLLGIAWELSDYIGVSEFGTTVEEIEVDGEFVLGSAIIWLREELAPPPTATPIRPTRVPTPTPAATATPLPTPQATPSRPQATPSQPQATPSRPQATPQPTPLPRATGGPGAVYLGDGSWATLAGPALRPEFQSDRRFPDLGDNGQVPMEAILQHKWIFESDYYQSLLGKARLNNPTSLTSSGESITLRHACVNRTLNWCRHLEAYFAPNVAARTNGQVRIEISSFPELGLSGIDTADLLADGTLAMAEVYGGYVSAEFPSLEIQSLWGLWPDDQTLFQVQGAIAPELDRIVADKMGAQVLFRNWIADGGQFLFSRTEIGTPEDFKGLRVRSFGDTLSDWISGMGGEPRPVAFAEVYTSLERGILDVGISNANSGYSQRWYEVANYMNGPLYSFSSTINAVNRGAWDSIPADLQQILIEEGAKHELEALRLAAVQGSAAVERATDGGLRLVELGPEMQAKSLQVARENVIPGWLYRIGYSSVDRRPPAPQAAASRGGPTPQPLWVPPTPTAQERQTLSVRAARAVDIFNRMVGPVVGLRIEADGTVTELR
jgi:TRAP-type C4-dicarboxylate transport system substrate-binding protein